MTEGRKVGSVKWWNEKKGFGFLIPHESGNDVFVHITAVEKAGLEKLIEGQKIEYDLLPSRGKFAAMNLKVVA